MRKAGFWIVSVVAAIGVSAPAFATEQVYHPISPALGGNPSNGTFLLSTAQAQGEGVNSGNQGPNLTPLANALGNLGTGTGTPGQTGGAATGGAALSSGGKLANPLGTNSGMP